MVETAEAVVTTTTAPVANANEQQAQQNNPIDINELSRMAFGGEKPQEGQEGQQAAVTGEQTPVTTVPVPAVVTTPENGVDVNEFLKKEFGWENPEAAKKEIEKLRAAPPAADPQFANEETKKIYEHLKAGNTKQVKEYLEAQELMANVDTMPEEDQLKLYIKMQNPRFDKELVQDEYDSLYKIEEDSIHDPMKLRKEKLRLEQRIENDVKKAQEFFTQYKQKIELPEISSTAAVVDKDYEAFKASNAKADESYNNIIVPGLTSLKETDVPFVVSMNDEGNKMQFEINIVPEAADFEAARQDSLSYDFTKTIFDKDGKFLPAEMQKIMLLRNNFEKYAQSIARQAVNAERKRVLEQETTGGGVQRDFNTTHVEPTELQKLEKMAFG